MKNNKRVYRILICAVIAIIFGIVGELVYNLPVIKERKNKYESIDLDKVEYEGFELEKELVQKNENARIRIEFPEQYVDKFIFNYYGNDKSEFKCKLIAFTRDTEGKKSQKEIVENNNIIAQRSVTNIRMKVNSIEIVIEDQQNIRISQIAIDNTGNFSSIRFLVVFTIVFWLLWFFIGYGKGIEKPEYIFATMTLMIGIIVVLALPSHKIGWDEEIHFKNAYGLSYLMEMKDEMFYPPSAELLSVSSLQNWPYDLASSEEEKKDELSYWNANGSEELKDNPQLYTEAIPIQLNLIGYTVQAIFIEIAKILNLPFSVMYMLGRLGNLLMYVVVSFFAIRHIPIGKILLAVIAMMPTPLFLATVYSYDATVNAFVFLGIAYWLGELLSEKEKISLKNYLIFVIAISIASCVKAVYAPLLLLGILIPERKFKNKKEEYWLKGITVFLMLGLAATFLIPTESRTDTRGGDTGVGRQLKLIFLHPWNYTKLLLSNIWNRLLDFSIGTSSMSLVGHLGEVKYTQWIIAFLTAVVLTEKKDDTGKMKKAHKVIIGGIIFVIICLIWTALYLSYTPVGADVIEGVQGRYFIPLLLPGFLLFDFATIREKIDYKKYSKIVLCTALYLTMLSYYDVFIKSCF